MIKVYKDILEKLKIENVFLTGETNAFCTVLEIEGNKWVVSTDKNFYTDSAVLNIKVEGEYMEIPVKVDGIESGLYRLLLSSPQSSGHQFSQLMQRINELEKNHEIWEKRKEERFNIGIKKSEDFLLSKPEQTIVYDKKELPCLVNNVSFSGANITTVSFSGSEFRRGAEVFLVLKFNSPIERIILKANIQSVAVKSSHENARLKFALLSMQIINPPLAYKERINAFIHKKDSKGA